jgi:hypothetical protein
MMQTGTHSTIRIYSMTTRTIQLENYLPLKWISYVRKYVLHIGIGLAELESGQSKKD